MGRGISTTAFRSADKRMNDSLDHATGLEKREILARQSGREGPYEMQVYKRVAGTKANPNIVPSVADFRVVGCVCEEDATAISWMWLYKGNPNAVNVDTGLNWWNPSLFNEIAEIDGTLSELYRWRIKQKQSE